MAARISIARRRCLTALSALAAGAALAAPPAAGPALRAEILRVDRSFIPSQATPIPGAGVRAFRDPAAGSAGSEQFDIHWLAPPPGLPPGAVLMLEAIHAQSPAVQNQVRPLPGRSAGRMHSTLTIPRRRGETRGPGALLAHQPGLARTHSGAAGVLQLAAVTPCPLPLHPETRSWPPRWTIAPWSR